MKGLLTSVLLVTLIACGVSGDLKLGSRAECEYGGTLTDCENADRTVLDACWRLVDCGAIIVHHETNDGAFDWDNCVNELETTTEDRRRVVVGCIASSTCDELRTGLCLELGDI
jgi:hypothetical protein